jgi:hypothetical protein
MSQNGAKNRTLKYKHNIGGASPALPFAYYFIAVSVAANVDSKK